MKQREVTDSENTNWTCVQVFSMREGKETEKAEALAKTEDGKVTVVCTPNGGAKTVRLELSRSWEDDLTDENLIELIGREKR
ncbi:MAG: hypothetical protein M3040_02980 [Bacteroidota bacterium]|nr:hypothetical protein [Bacteroidota bacterium]